MKKLNLLFTALMFVCCIGMAKAHDFSVSGIYYSISSFTNKTVKVTHRGTYHDEYYEYFGSVVIPESVNYNGKTYSVTSIGNSAFYGCYGLTSITIPNSVTSIGDCAFYGCSGLTSITIPNSVTFIGDYAFYKCTGLTSVTIGNSVKSIGGSAFNGCTGLTSVTIGNSVKSIGGDAFNGCTGLTNVVIGNSVTSIGEEAFYGCTSLKTVINFSKFTFSERSSNYGYVAYYADKVYNAPNSFIDGDYIWFENEGTMTLAGYIGDAAELTLPAVYNGKSVTSIGESAFSYCDGFTSVVIGNSVTSIGSGAFSYCDGLTSVVIGNSVTSIGSGAFYGCFGLTSITIPNSVTSIGEEAFYGTDWYNSQPDGVVYAGKVLYKYKGRMPSNTSITIKEGTLSITDYAFYECSGLTSITIPNSVKSIGNYAFNRCGLTSVTIGNSVTSIGQWAFYNCKGLTSVTSLIPADNLFVPGYDSFYNVNKTSCTLYVPYGAKETYAATAGWSEFTNIVEMEPVSQPGDINNDGEVNVGDFAALANIIFNSEEIDETTKSASDINADGEVNVGDFAALVNLIFNSGSQTAPQRAATRTAADETTFYIEPFSIAAGETKVIPVLMENPDEVFSQLQFDITLPEGLEIPVYFDEEQFDDVKDIKRGCRTKSVYSIQTQPVGEALRVLCITQNSKAYFTGESGDVLLITVKAADEMAIGDVEIKITNTVLSRQDGTTYKPADCTATVSVTEVPTGIDDVKEQRAESKDVYYDLSGRAVENPTMGINILNGKKVLVK
ncbi:MAG: leucine-rich repeat protein [Bacteroidaceae bacterium]|nr:leucine-rich repeat protein [Bacteroidaceae bacterium]